MRLKLDELVDMFDEIQNYWVYENPVFYAGF